MKKTILYYIIDCDSNKFYVIAENINEAIEKFMNYCKNNKYMNDDIRIKTIEEITYGVIM